ncbi:uncharacterized protein LOC125100272 isoform X2 [Lutra lutra]|uniref:uncharacterized protein LOC125100272 isoform X2 n=1 Tax=Lutra lutra TaxID=9657 RepID=UPI001FD19081|nr:uncharacterized protein LOC125100272 isoform X2 [Lutra lutra]
MLLNPGTSVKLVQHWSSAILIDGALGLSWMFLLIFWAWDLLPEFSNVFAGNRILLHLPGARAILPKKMTLDFLELVQEAKGSIRPRMSAWCSPKNKEMQEGSTALALLGEARGIG